MSNKTNPVNFESEFGIVKPGDPVVVTTVSTGTIRQALGTYLGLSQSGKVQCQIQDRRWRYVRKDTGEAVRWSGSIPYNQLEWKQVTIERITTLQRNRMIPLRPGQTE